MTVYVLRYFDYRDAEGHDEELVGVYGTHDLAVAAHRRDRAARGYPKTYKLFTESAPLNGVDECDLGTTDLWYEIDERTVQA